MDYVKCTICGKKLKPRRTSSGWLYPAYHKRDRLNPCHGFFVECQPWKESEGELQGAQEVC